MQFIIPIYLLSLYFIFLILSLMVSSEHFYVPFIISICFLILYFTILVLFIIFPRGNFYQSFIMAVSFFLLSFAFLMPCFIWPYTPFIKALSFIFLYLTVQMLAITFSVKHFYIVIFKLPCFLLLYMFCRFLCQLCFIKLYL